MYGRGMEENITDIELLEYALAGVRAQIARLQEQEKSIERLCKDTTGDLVIEPAQVEVKDFISNMREDKPAADRHREKQHKVNAESRARMAAAQRLRWRNWRKQQQAAKKERKANG